MRLHPGPFARIRNGTKVLELRLRDEKRSGLRIGDAITFVNRANPDESLEAVIVDLHFAASFKELADRFGVEATEGLDPEAYVTAMRAYYSEAEERALGVVGIRIRRVVE